jgi:hypothetical protein
MPLIRDVLVARCLPDTAKFGAMHTDKVPQNQKIKGLEEPFHVLIFLQQRRDSKVDASEPTSPTS